MCDDCLSLEYLIFVLPLIGIWNSSRLRCRSHEKWSWKVGRRRMPALTLYALGLWYMELVQFEVEYWHERHITCWREQSALMAESLFKKGCMFRCTGHKDHNRVAVMWAQVPIGWFVCHILVHDSIPAYCVLLSAAESSKGVGTQQMWCSRCWWWTMVLCLVLQYIDHTNLYWFTWYLLQILQSIHNKIKVSHLVPAKLECIATVIRCGQVYGNLYQPHQYIMIPQCKYIRLEAIHHNAIHEEQEF